MGSSSSIVANLCVLPDKQCYAFAALLAMAMIITNQGFCNTKFKKTQTHILKLETIVKRAQVRTVSILEEESSKHVHLPDFPDTGDASSLFRFNIFISAKGEIAERRRPSQRSSLHHMTCVDSISAHDNPLHPSGQFMAFFFYDGIDKSIIF